MKKPKLIIIIAVCVFIALIAPYIKVEYLTRQHGSEFATLYKTTHMIDGIDYFKVMNYSEESASVYYVASRRASGNLVTFVKKDGQWVKKKMQTIWSKTGSADGFIWPYYK